MATDPSLATGSTLHRAQLDAALERELPRVACRERPQTALIWTRFLRLASVLNLVFTLDQVSLLVANFWLLRSLKLESVFWTNFRMGALLWAFGFVVVLVSFAAPAFAHPVPRSWRRTAIEMGVLAGSIAGYLMALRYGSFLLGGKGQRAVRQDRSGVRHRPRVLRLRPRQHLVHLAPRCSGRRSQRSALSMIYAWHTRDVDSDSATHRPRPRPRRHRNPLHSGVARDLGSGRRRRRVAHPLRPAVPRQLGLGGVDRRRSARRDRHPLEPQLRLPHHHADDGGRLRADRRDGDPAPRSSASSETTAVRPLRALAHHLRRADRCSTSASRCWSRCATGPASSPTSR